MRLRSRLHRLDKHLYAAVAQARLPGLERVLPPLSRAADNALLWAGVAGTFALSGRSRLRRAATRGLLAVSLASPLVNLAGKQAFGRKRPVSDELPLARLLKTPLSASFPSGHSASAAAFATAVALEAPIAVAVPVSALAAAVCFSRVYTGVHYPGDVLAGMAIGVAAGLVTRRIWPEASEAGRARASATAPAFEVDPSGEGLAVAVESAADEVAQTLRKAFPRAEFVPLDAIDRAGGKALAVAGGDAAVSRGAQAALDLGRPLLVVPTATPGHFAAELGIADAPEAVAAYQAGDLAAVDVGEVAGRVFVGNAGLGLYPSLADRREARQKRIGTWPALLWGLAEVLGRDAAPVDVVVDGVPYRAWMLFVGNCRHGSRGPAPGRRARLEDGVLDIRLLTAARRLPRLRAFGSVIGGRLRLSRHYRQWTADTVRVETPSGEVRLARDGETVTARGPLTFVKRPRSLHVFR
ncbi:bifunctional phosphatase PAP2/diacylglycerol kinase family protein [Nonomuraea sp. NPDC059194]|uniref:bifunctional phosphatase PAP2/diacylglycerol kinase family protein n=1 Tax=Nonomuraea sp. NPDC059194 TaxID=3346764 RepID=UPI0036C17096